jgi:hypothetical protein
VTCCCDPGGLSLEQALVVMSDIHAHLAHSSGTPACKGDRGGQEWKSGRPCAHAHTICQ